MARATGTQLLRRCTENAQVPKRLAHALVQKQSSDSVFLRHGRAGVPQQVQHWQQAAAPETHVSTLTNGLRVATCAKPHTRTACIGAWIDAGTRFEAEQKNGSAHFLEHMIFKGTTNRSAAQIEAEAENLGAPLNAYTTREQTMYMANVQSKDVTWGTELLADVLQSSTLEQAALDRERNIILREAQEIEKDTDELVLDHLHSTAFQHSPLGLSIIGPEENVRTISREDIQSYVNTHYNAQRMVLVGTGAVNHEQMCEAANKLFGNLSAFGPTAAECVEKNPSKFTGSEVRIRDDDFEKLHFSIAFEGPSYDDPDLIPMMVLQRMLGSYTRSSFGRTNTGTRLAHYMAANNLAERYYAFNHPYSDTGLFGVHAVTDEPMSADDLAWVIMNEMCGLSYVVEEDDVTRAKEQLKSSLVSAQDMSHAGLAEEVGRHVLQYGRHVPRTEMFARIDAVTAESIKAAAQRFLNDQEICVAALGQTQFLPDYTWLRRYTYSNLY